MYCISERTVLPYTDRPYLANPCLQAVLQGTKKGHVLLSIHKHLEITTGTNYIHL